MPTMSKRAVFCIFPALLIQILEHSVAIGCCITVFAIAHAMTHRAAHVVHHAGCDGFNAGIHCRRIQGHTAPSADAKNTDPVAIHLCL
ncbi:hypothetical protein D3C80_1284670 [compost metagenome]